MEQEGLMEHRWGKRIDVDIPVRLHVSSRLHEHSAHLANLSLSGAWTPIGIGIQRLSIIQVEFELPLLLSGPRTVNAFVARQSGDGTGLAWCEQAPEVVVRLLQARAAEPRPILSLKVAARKPVNKSRTMPSPSSPPAKRYNLKPGARWSDEYKERMQLEMNALVSRAD